MGLDLETNDNKYHIHMSYTSFAHMRGLFASYYEKSFYKKYISFLDIPKEKVGDLSILLEHSDCDGELTSDECKKIIKCLNVNKDLINESIEDEKYAKHMYESMLEFKKMINYCTTDDNIKILFW